MSDIKRRITDLYSERYMRKSAIRKDDAVIFQRLLTGKNYRIILEIGTYRGCTAAELSQYCDKVITIDLKHGRIEKDELSIDRNKFWESLGINNVEMILVADDAEKKKVVNALDFDFAFVDGAHDYNGVSGDFELVRRCGRVLFHDYEHRGPPQTDDVYHFVNAIPDGKVRAEGVFALWTK